MTRYLYSGVSDQRNAAIRRMADAHALYEKRHWCGAMYLMGYAVECRLKTALMEKYRTDTLEKLEDILTRRMGREVSLKEHNLERLLDLLGLSRRLVGRDGSKQNFYAFIKCNRWNVAWRYRPDEGSAEECQDFFDAVIQFLNFIRHNC